MVGNTEICINNTSSFVAIICACSILQPFPEIYTFVNLASDKMLSTCHSYATVSALRKKLHVRNIVFYPLVHGKVATNNFKKVIKDQSV